VSEIGKKNCWYFSFNKKKSYHFYDIIAAPQSSIIKILSVMVELLAIELALARAIWNLTF